MVFLCIIRCYACEHELSPHLAPGIDLDEVQGYPVGNLIDPESKSLAPIEVIAFILYRGIAGFATTGPHDLNVANDDLVTLKMTGH